MILFSLLLSVAQPAPAPAQSAPPSTSSAPVNLNFDLLEPQKADSAFDRAHRDQLERLSERRRTILTLHTYIGYALLATMTATVVLGQLNYYDKFGGGGFTNRYDVAHEISAYTSTALFATNGILALVAPTPYEKPGRWDTARIHRILEAAAAAGMATDIVLGPVSETKYGQLAERQFATAHLVVGYVTYALIVGGFLAYFFN